MPGGRAGREQRAAPIELRTCGRAAADQRLLDRVGPRVGRGRHVGRRSVKCRDEFEQQPAGILAGPISRWIPSIIQPTFLPSHHVLPRSYRWLVWLPLTQ